LTEIAVVGAVWSMLLLLLTQFNANILHEPHVWCRLAVQLLPACGAGKRFAQAPDWRPAYTQTREYACINNGRSSICSCAPFSEASVAQKCLKSEVTPAVHLGLSDPTSLQCNPSSCTRQQALEMEDTAVLTHPEKNPYGTQDNRCCVNTLTAPCLPLLVARV
jgi:hypothetical protein